MCGCGKDVCTCGHGHSRTIGKFLLMALLFLVLSPGILLTIPAAGGKGMFMSGQTSIISAAVHAVIFVSIVFIARKIHHMYKAHLRAKRISEIRREMEEHIQSEALEAIMYTQWQQSAQLSDMRRNCKSSCSARATANAVAVVVEPENSSENTRGNEQKALPPAPVKHVEPGQTTTAVHDSNDWYNDPANHVPLVVNKASPAIPSPSAMLGGQVGGVSSPMSMGAPARG